MEKKGSDSRKKVEESTTESVEKTPVVTVPPKEEGAVATKKETPEERKNEFTRLKGKSAMYVREFCRVNKHTDPSGCEVLRNAHYAIYTEDL